MFAALHMLLCADRTFSLGDNQRLPAILHKQPQISEHRFDQAGGTGPRGAV
jgi:hypothetical protein